MSTPIVRLVPLLTLSLLAVGTSLAYAEELDPYRELQADEQAQADEQVGGAQAADTAVDAGAGGSSSRPTTSVGTGGAGKLSGTREMAGPDMGSCSCRTHGRTPTQTGFGLLMIAAVGVLLRRATR